MQSPAELAVWFRLQNYVGLFVSKPFRAADHAFSKTPIFGPAAVIEINENGVSEAIDAWIQAANAVA